MNRKVGTGRRTFLFHAGAETGENGVFRPVRKTFKKKFEITLAFSGVMGYYNLALARNEC